VRQHVDSLDYHLVRAKLRALDARTGQPILSFGSGGRVDLKAGLDRDPTTIRLVQSTTPGRVFEDLLEARIGAGIGYAVVVESGHVALALVSGWRHPRQPR